MKPIKSLDYKFTSNGEDISSIEVEYIDGSNEIVERPSEKFLLQVEQQLQIQTVIE